MNKSVIYILLTVILILGLFLFLTKGSPNGDHDITPTPVVVPDTTPTPVNDEDVVISDNWVEYTNDSLGFSIEHPDNMEIGEPPIGGTVFTYLGPTQTDATEIFDGINVTITREAMPERFASVEAFARSRMEESREHGEIVEELTPITINGLDGYAFTLESLGVIRHIIVEHSPGVTLQITYIDPDPEERGYSEVVDRMLATLEVIQL